MKNFIKLLGIISMVLVIGFGMAACKHGGDEDPPGPGPNGGGGGGGGKTYLSFTGTPPADVAAATFWGKKGVYEASTLPTTRSGITAHLGDKIAEVFSMEDGKCELLKYMTVDPFDATGPHVVNIGLDNSGNKDWYAVVTFTNGNGTLDWATAINENTLP